MNRCLSYNIEKEKQVFFKTLKLAGGRITKQREKMIQVILELKRPFSAEELSAELEETSIDLATIYRSLKSFLKLQLLRPVDFNDGVLRYEYKNKQSHSHHHIVCTSCNSVQALDDCVLAEQENRLTRLGYRNVRHKLEFFGLCQKCQ